MSGSAIDVLLESVDRGRVTMVAGRPGSGVTTALAHAASRWVATGGRAVMACWERPPALLMEEFPHLDRVEVPYIIAWSIEELETWIQAESLHEEDTLIAVDYLQLVEGPDEVCANTAALPRRAELRVLLGAMATRAVIPAIEQDPPDGILRAFARDIDAMRGGDQRHVHRLAALEGADPSQKRRLVLSAETPQLDEVHCVIERS